MYQIVLVIVLLFQYSNTQDANCDFYQNVLANTRYTIQSPNYPSSYPKGVTCRWQAQCPSGYNCRLDCVLKLPQSTKCAVDSFFISKTGDPQMTSADYYCGEGTISAVSVGQSISTALFTSSSSPGGSFRCDLYAQTSNTAPTCSCGYRRMNRIVGGVETSPYEYTMMAGIVFLPEDEIRCGGVIISRNHVLTAAHCVADKTPTTIRVDVGVHNINNYSPPRQAFRVSRILPHPNYVINSANYDYDIAILYLSTPITFNAYIGPVCLPFKYANTDFTNALVTAPGWGTLYIGGPRSTVLRQVDLNVISQTSCQSSVPSLTSRQLCTYSRGKDACQDDSGGPLLLADQSGALFCIGLISYGQFCASTTPGVNTRVTALLNWITTNAPADYCRR